MQAGACAELGPHNRSLPPTAMVVPGTRHLPVNPSLRKESMDHNIPDTICAGSFLRVWWRLPPDASTAHACEWAEVIRIEKTKIGAATLRCETLGKVAFSFVPTDVARGVDAHVVKFEVQAEVAPHGDLRRSEVNRLRQALHETCGRIGTLSREVDPALCNAGFTVAPSQVRVKATLLTHSGSASQRQSLQERLEVTLEQFADDLHETDQKQQLLQQPLQLRQSSEVNQRHRPELCPECIRKANWCSGSLHLPDAAARIAKAAESLLTPGSGTDRQSPNWYVSDSGIEAEMFYNDQPVLIQLRPWHFCISETDAALFGKPARLAPRLRTASSTTCDSDMLAPRLRTASSTTCDSDTDTNEDITPALDLGVDDSEEGYAAGQRASILSGAGESPMRVWAALVSPSRFVRSLGLSIATSNKGGAPDMPRVSGRAV